MLYHPLDAILGSSSKVRLLRVMLPLNRPVSGREAARLAGLSVRAIARLDELVDVGVLSRREATGQHLYAVNTRHVLATHLRELYESEVRWTAAILEYLRSHIGGPATASQITAAGVIGSAARGESRPGSDFDVLVITTDDLASEAVWPHLMDAQHHLQDQFGIDLSPTVITEAAWEEMLANDDAFACSAAQDAVLFSGELPSR